MTISVQEYYDENTTRFLRFGHGRNCLAIHRAVWWPGVKTREQAMDFANRVIADEVRNLAVEKATVFDLGCGVGGTLFYLCQKTQAIGYGITNSKRQHAIARNLCSQLALQDRVTIEFGDYNHLPASFPNCDLAYAIESFVHTDDPKRFFSEISQKLSEVGILILIDDFAANEKVREREIVRDFVTGWYAPSLLTVDEIEALIADCHLRIIENVCLNEYLQLNRPRDWAIRLLVPLLRLFGRGYYASSLLGGNALQRCLAANLVQYRILKIGKV